MNPTQRIIVNTLAQYTKAVITMILSLYSTRLILDALSISDYGIYSVVGGVVAMLGFINAALIVTTQRYVSFYLGQGQKENLHFVFTNSLLLHLLLGLALCAVLFLLEGWLMGGILNIPADRMTTAGRIYEISIAALFITIVTAPFKALFIAHENIIYISVVEVIDAVVKLLLAIGLIYVTFDKLLFYALMIAFIQLLNLLAFSVMAVLRYEESCLLIKRKCVSLSHIMQLLGFAGWTTYGMGAITFRNQGTAIILNHFLGTVVNAAYGIAFQIYAAVSFVSSSILNAMNPQIMKAEGNNERMTMLRLAEQESKFSFTLLAIATIPLVFELPTILSLWLKEVPENTAMFCSFILVSCLADQLTIGLHAANQATGRIMTYTLLMFTPKLLALPLFWYMLAHGASTLHVMEVFLGIECFMAVIRIPYMRLSVGMSVSSYCRHVIVPVLPLCLAMVAVGFLCTHYLAVSGRFVITIVLSVSIGLLTAWHFTLGSHEKAYVVRMVRNKLKPHVP